MLRPSFSRILAGFGLLFALMAGDAIAAADSTSTDTTVHAPPRAGTKTPPSLPAPTKNTYETITGDEQFKTFAKMIESADLKDLFTTPASQPMTVFAPTNAAMEALPEGTLKRIESSKANLQSFVKYHVISNSLVSGSAVRGRKIAPASANGEPLLFDGTDRDHPAHVNNGELVGKDQRAVNGIVHGVSTALVPPSLRDTPPATPKVSAAPPQVVPNAPVGAPPTAIVTVAKQPSSAVAVTSTGAASGNPISATTTSAVSVTTSALDNTTTGAISH